MLMHPDDNVPISVEPATGAQREYRPTATEVDCQKTEPAGLPEQMSGLDIGYLGGLIVLFRKSGLEIVASGDDAGIQIRNSGCGYLCRADVDKVMVFISDWRGFVESKKTAKKDQETKVRPA